MQHNSKTFKKALLEKQWPYHTVQSVLTSSLLGLLIVSESVTDTGHDSLQLFSDNISNQSVNFFKPQTTITY